MNPTSVDVKDMLEAESSLGLVFADNLYVGREPAEPDDVVVIYDTPGGSPDLTLSNDAGFHRPSVQILVRNRSYNSGYILALSILNALHGRGPETWNSTVYHPIVCVSGPALLDWDVNGRARFIINFKIMRRS